MGMEKHKIRPEKDHDESLYHGLVHMREVKLKVNPTKWIFFTKHCLLGSRSAHME